MLPEVNDVVDSPVFKDIYPEWVVTVQGHKYHYHMGDDKVVGQFATLSGKAAYSYMKPPSNYKMNFRGDKFKEDFANILGVNFVDVNFRKDGDTIIAIMPYELRIDGLYCPVYTIRGLRGYTGYIYATRGTTPCTSEECKEIWDTLRESHFIVNRITRLSTSKIQNAYKTFKENEKGSIK